MQKFAALMVLGVSSILVLLSSVQAESSLKRPVVSVFQGVARISKICPSHQFDPLKKLRLRLLTTQRGSVETAMLNIDESLTIRMSRRAQEKSSVAEYRDSSGSYTLRLFGVNGYGSAQAVLEKKLYECAVLYRARQSLRSQS